MSSAWTGVIGIILSSLSLGWQAATFALTGGRIKVSLRIGGMNASGMLTMPIDSVRENSLEQVASQGYGRLVVAVQVANVGRLPVTVARWSLQHPEGIGLSPIGASVGPPLPHRLEVGQSETWALDLSEAMRFVAACNETVGEDAKKRRGIVLLAIHDVFRPFGVFARVELAAGKSKRTRGVLR
jgi:hypothetical protein